MDSPFIPSRVFLGLELVLIHIILASVQLHEKAHAGGTLQIARSQASDSAPSQPTAPSIRAAKFAKTVLEFPKTSHEAET